MSKNLILFLVGPTGSGKTRLSLKLARRLHSEIISADSMVVYRGMNIGTAKASPKDQEKMPHHLIDLVSPSRSFSVHDYRVKAMKALQSILKRGRTPLVVGGSGLYVDSLWKGLSPLPGEDPKVRKKLNERAQKKGVAHLYNELKKSDPERAACVDPHNLRRIVRALEIAHTSGKTATQWHGQKVSLEDLGYSVRIFGISRERSDLYERINRRVQAMFREGFLKEVERLRKRRFSKTAAQALGYREVIQYLKEGKKKSLTEVQSEIQQRTRQFAKRQLTWFRHHPEIEWVDWREGETAQDVCDKILMRLGHA